MTKSEAIEAMDNGSRVTHRFFSEKEWMEIKDNKIHLEDGVICGIAEFFNSRGDKSWEDGYSIINK